MKGKNKMNFDDLIWSYNAYVVISGIIIMLLIYFVYKANLEKNKIKVDIKLLNKKIEKQRADINLYKEEIKEKNHQIMHYQIKYEGVKFNLPEADVEYVPKKPNSFFKAN